MVGKSVGAISGFEIILESCTRQYQYQYQNDIGTLKRAGIAQ
jgi:hypothetical protein